jgi:tricorn protease
MRTLVTLLCWAGVCSAADGPYLLQHPTMNQTHIVFSFAGDLWSVERKGGAATRLTTGKGQEAGAHFSPDGKMVAFTGEYDGSVDVFVVPATGGIPKRLTHHTAPDAVVGWTADSKRVLFNSNRENWASVGQLYTVPVEGGFPEKLPLPHADSGALSPDGSEIAYLQLPRADQIW